MPLKLQLQLRHNKVTLSTYIPFRLHKDMGNEEQQLPSLQEKGGFLINLFLS